MIYIYKATVFASLPHPSLTQFNEQPLINCLWDRDDLPKVSKVLLKYWYFYTHEANDPLLISYDGTRLELHPGNKRFIGTSLRAPGTPLAAYLVSDRIVDSLPGMLLELVGSYPQEFLGVDAEAEDLVAQVTSCVDLKLDSRNWSTLLAEHPLKGAYSIVLANGRTIVMNYRGRDTGISVNATDYPTIFDALRALFETVAKMPHP